MTDALSGSQKGRGDGSPLVAGHEGEGRGFTKEREKAPLVAGHEAAGRDAHGGRLLADEHDKLAGQLQHAMTGFVDGPRAAVEEADHVLEEVTSRFTDAMAQRRRTLRQSWQGADDDGDGKRGGSGDTEQLRLALRDYRELTERLLKL